MQAHTGCRMHKLERISLTLPFFIAVFLLAAKPAYANEPLVFMAFSGSPTLTIALGTLGIGFVIVVLIEAYVIMRYTGFEWVKAFEASLIMNTISTLAGAAAGGFVGITGCFFLFLLPLLIIGMGITLWKQKRSGWFITLVVILLLLGFVAVGSIWSSANSSIPWLWFCIFIQVVFGFGMTLGFEAIVGRPYFAPGKVESTVLRANLFSYIFILLAAPFFWPNPVAQMVSTSESELEIAVKHYSAESAVGMFYRKELSTPQLLGLKKVRREQVAEFAEDAITMTESQLQEWAYEKSLVGIGGPKDFFDSFAAFANEAALVSGLTDEEQKSLQWLGELSAHWSDASAAVFEDDAGKLREVLIDWEAKKKEIDAERYRDGDAFDLLPWIEKYVDKNGAEEDIRDVIAKFEEAGWQPAVPGGSP